MTEPQGGARPDRGRLLPWILGGAAVVVVVYLFRGLVLPLFLAAGVAYLLNPLIVWAEGIGTKRSVAVMGLYLAFALVVVGGGFALGPRLRAEAGALAEGLPALTDQVEAAIDLAVRELRDTYPGLRRVLPNPEGRTRWLEPLVAGRGGNLTELLEHAGKVFITVVLVPLFAFLLLRDSRRAIAFVMDRLPPIHIETTVAVWCEIEQIIGRYLRGVALDVLAVGVLASVGLWALGVPYPLLLGAFAGLANAVPFLGPILGASAAGLAVLTDGQGIAAVARVVALFVAIKVVDDVLLQPLTIGRSLHLHPMLLLASVVAGNQALGIFGMVLAVPFVTALQEIARLLLEHHRAMAGPAPTSGEAAAAPHYVC